MEWKDLGALLGKVAPLIGTAIVGPAGGAVGSLVSAALGVANEPDAVHKALTVDPEAAIKLQALQNENEAMLKRHIEKMADIELEYERSRVEERKSSHSREIALANAGKANLEQPILAFIGVGGFIILTGYVVIAGLPQMDKETAFIVGSLIGSVSMIAKDIYGYYFGSSKGSKDKTAIMSYQSGGKQ